MKTLTSPISTQAAAAQSGWCELYDFYLKSSVSTPWGTTNTLRLTTLPGGCAFFTPKIAPEPSGAQGNAQAYNEWPIKRQAVKGSNKFTNDKLIIIASNVTTDFASIIAAVDWEGTPVIIRKVSMAITSPTADDCALIFSGLVDKLPKITNDALQFTCSNDLGTFSLNAPRENMHAICRFRWADDQCTAIRFLPANYKSKTCGSSSSTTNVKSAGLTEDSGAKGAYGTDLVAALSNGAITASSYQTGFAGVQVTFAAIRAGIFTPSLTPPPNQYFYFVGAGANVSAGLAIKFATTGSMPTGLTAGTTYYLNTFPYGIYGLYTVSATLGGSPIVPGSAGSGTISISTVFDFNPYQVKAGLFSSNGSYWAMGNASDWGNINQAYWQIPDTQAGLANPALTPYIQFDFGSAVQPTLWQVRGTNTGNIEDLPRLILFFSSTNNSTWKFETYFECPPLPGDVPNQPGPLFDVLIPGAENARYWRICVRTRWSATVGYPLFQQVSAYAGSRNYWQDGQITFDPATTTTALQGVTRSVLESYSGELICAPLPAAPVSGDVFIIERGCGRTFNACAFRQNTENFGGFDSMPFETIIR